MKKSIPFVQEKIVYTKILVYFKRHRAGTMNNTAKRGLGHHTMKKRKFCRLLCCSVITAVIASASGCGLLPQEEQLPTAPLLVESENEEYVVSEVVRGDVRITETVRSTYTPSASQRLGFSLGDERISGIYVQVGDTVEAGDVLMELDLSDIDDQIRAQQNQIDQLQLQLQHVYEQKALSVSQAQIQDEQAAENSVPDWTSMVNEVTQQYNEQAQQLENSISVAKLRLQELQDDKKERQIIAPISGTITYMYEFQEGERSKEGESIITIADMSQSLFEVYSENASLLVPGETYSLTCQDTEYEVVAHLGSELNLPVTKPEGMYLTLVTPDPTIEQGASGSVTLVLEESLDTLYVVSSAVKDLQGQKVVYCINDQGYREIRPVTTGLITGSVTEITDGLTEGEVVIIE